MLVESSSDEEDADDFQSAMIADKEIEEYAPLTKLKTTVKNRILDLA